MRFGTRFYLSPLSFLRPTFPELRRTGRAGAFFDGYQGLKPQAQSCSPFGTKLRTSVEVLPRAPSFAVPNRNEKIKEGAKFSRLILSGSVVNIERKEFV
jgi:hypothetical protein